MNKKMWDLLSRLHTGLARYSGPFTMEQLGAKAGLTAYETWLQSSMIGRCMKRLGWERSTELVPRYYRNGYTKKRAPPRRHRKRDVEAAIQYVRDHQGIEQYEHPSPRGALLLAIEQGHIQVKGRRLYVA